MSKGTPLKDAIRQWEEKHEDIKITDAEEVKLIGIYPPIEKLDSSLSKMPACQKLSLSTNAIEKISNFNALKNLKILSIGRNNIKSFAGLEVLADTLEQLWISYNNIERMKGINILRKLVVLFMSNNSVKEWSEFSKLSDLPLLEDLVFTGNPLEERYSMEGTWREEVMKRLQNIKRLDGAPVIR